MAPKNKFTREEMIAAALKIVRRNGAGSLTAKAIADELGISTRPVFTCFGTMDTVKNEVRQAAEEIYNGYIGEGLKEKIPFFGLGMQYIRFAKEEPELYRLLFLMQTADGSSGAFQSMLHSQETARGSLVKIYNMTEAEADRYFRDLWLVVRIQTEKSETFSQASASAYAGLSKKLKALHQTALTEMRFSKG